MRNIMVIGLAAIFLSACGESDAQRQEQERAKTAMQMKKDRQTVQGDAHTKSNKIRSNKINQ